MDNNLDNIWIMENSIEIFPGDEFLFDRTTIQNMINIMSLDLLNTFDISISKVSENKWRVRFGNLPTGTILIK